MSFLLVVLLDAYIVLYCLFVSVSFNRVFLFSGRFLNISGFVVFWWFVVLLMVLFFGGWCFISCWFIGFSGFLGFGVFWSLGGLIFGDFLEIF